MAEKERKLSFGKVISGLFTFLIISFFLSGFLQTYLAQTNYLEGNVAIIDVTGPITVQAPQSPFATSQMASSERIMNQIDKARTNDQIKAVIFNINSPGGSGVASEEVSRALDSLNKTSVAVIREVGASAAYWIASGTNHIIANPLSAVGSIGVYASYLEFSGFLEDHNITYTKLTSQPSKDIGSPFRELRDDERVFIEDMLDQSHSYFMNYVAEHRGLSANQIREVNRSLFYNGLDAVDLNLVDSLGGMDDAVSYIENTLNISAQPARFPQLQGGLFSPFGGFSQASYQIGRGIGDSMLSYSISDQNKIKA